MSSNAVYVPPAKRAGAITRPRTLVTPPSPIAYTVRGAAPRLTLNTAVLGGRRANRTRTPSPQSSVSIATPSTATPSRPSSRASDCSDTNSLFSAVSTASSASSFAASPVARRVEKENIEQKEQVWAKKEVAVTGYLYQGGKTNVLGGGVMLGSPSQAKPRAAMGTGVNPRNARSAALLSALQPRLARA